MPNFAPSALQNLIRIQELNSACQRVPDFTTPESAEIPPAVPRVPITLESLEGILKGCLDSHFKDSIQASLCNVVESTVQRCLRTEVESVLQELATRGVLHGNGSNEVANGTENPAGFMGLRPVARAGRTDRADEVLPMSRQRTAWSEASAKDDEDDDEDDDAFLFQKKTFKIFTEGEENGTRKTHPKRKSIAFPVQAVQGKPVTTGIQCKPLPGEVPPPPPEEPDPVLMLDDPSQIMKHLMVSSADSADECEKKKGSKMTTGSRQSSKRSNGSAEKPPLPAQHRASRRTSVRKSISSSMTDAAVQRALDAEKAWLLELRAESTYDPPHMNDPDNFGSLEAWRASRTRCGRAELWLWEKLARIVTNVNFDYLCALFILSNSVTVGCNTDYSAKHIGADLPPIFRVFDLIFCVVFTTELAMKLYVHRLHLYVLDGWKWNAFDSLLVGMQLFEEILAVVLEVTAEEKPPKTGEDGEEEEEEGGVGMNLSFMRVLRILRLVRIVRLFRVLRVIGELRTIVASIVGCLKPLLSAMLLLLLMIYVVGVFFTQAVSQHFAEEAEKNPDAEQDPALVENFGTLSLSLFSLFQAILGGMDWGDIANPLTHELSTVYGLVFAFYIIFACLAMMNVMTGVFVEAALQISKRDDEIYMVNHMKQLLKVTDMDDSGEVSWEEFEAQLDNPDMMEYFKCIEVDPSEGRNIFNILDSEETGCVESESFVSGCLRLKGPARALDLEVFQLTTRKALQKTLQNQKQMMKLLQQKKHKHR